MRPKLHVRRVIVVVLDGLRPDAIDVFNLVNLRQLMQRGASTLTAQTVRPSLTWPALTSLLTGAEPAQHGILSDTLQIPRPRTPLEPLPQLLLRGGHESSAFLGDVPMVYRVFGARIAEKLGFHTARFAGTNAAEVMARARDTVQQQRQGLVFMHWGDADQAGHVHGWMSPRYGQAACGVDMALGTLAESLHVEHDPQTVLIAVADHGGGGVDATNHEADHPLNTTIPLAITGGAIGSRELGAVSLLDVPPTIAWLLGQPVPASYAGRPLVEIMDTATETAA